MANTQELINKVLGDIARPTKYSAEIYLPEIPGRISAENIEIMIKNTTLPGRKSEPINFMYMGKSIPIRGQTRYDQTIDVVLHLEENHRTKVQLENWMESNDYNGYLEKVPQESRDFAKNTVHYRGSIVLSQWDFDLNTRMVEYTLANAFPTSISAMELNSESTGQFSEITITFAFSHYSVNVLHENAVSTTGDFSYIKTPESSGIAQDKILNWVNKPEDAKASGDLSGIGDIGFDSAKASMADQLSFLASIANNNLMGMTASIGAFASGIGIGSIMSGVASAKKGFGSVQSTIMAASSQVNSAKKALSVVGDIKKNPVGQLTQAVGLNKSLSSVNKLKGDAKNILGRTGGLF